MSSLTWGAGGTNRSTNTSGVGDGWYTPNLAMPNVRSIYDGTQPIYVASVTATAGTGNRSFTYATGSSGWRTSGYHNITNASVFTFRVTCISGNITLGLLGTGSQPTYWVSSGDPVNWNPNGPQPGAMTYYQAASAPTVNTLTPSTTTAGAIAINISAPSDNGGFAVTTYTHQFSTNSSFTAVVKEQQSAASTTTFTGLPTGVTIYHRVMAVTAVSTGVGKKGGASSIVHSFSLGTAPVDAAAIAVASTPSGQGANITITPPTNTGGLPITGYNIEYNQTLPTTGPVIPVTFTGTTGTISGLTPGATYRYRVAAVNSVGPGPWSGYTTKKQANPSTNPGDYFDGSTTATDDQTYSWTGTANNSTSIAVGHAPTGWMPFSTGAATSGGTGVVARVTGGASLPSGLNAGLFAARATFFTDATAAGFMIGTSPLATGRATVSEGQTYTGSIYVRMSKANNVAARIGWYNTSGTFLSASVGTAVAVGAGVWTRLLVTADAPATTLYANVSVIDVAGGTHVNWLGGDTISADAAMITLGDDALPYFDGSFADDSNYAYSWTGTANASTSLREAVVTTAVDPLADPDCPPVPLPPRPPIVLDDCIEDVGIWRRYWAAIPSGNVTDWLTMLPTMILTTGDFAVRQVRIRVYPNPFDYSIDMADTTNYCSEQIISYIPPDTVFTLDGPLQRVFAEVAGGAAIAADHLLYGTGGVPASWPSLSCGISYLASFDVPLDAPLENFTQPRVLLTRRT
jgi:hypothetical protein